MSVPTATRSITYTGNGSTTTPYVIPFPFHSSAHIRVLISADGVVDPSVLSSSGYVVTPSTGGASGSLVTVAAVTDPAEITIERVVPLTQPSTFPAAGPFPAAAVETAVDRATMQIQQLSEAISVLEGGGTGGGGGTETGGPDTVTLNTSGSLDLSPLTNYRLTATFSGAGVFGDALYTSRLLSSRAELTISPEENARTAGKASWLVFLYGAPDYTPIACTFSGLLKGTGWTGASTTVTATWALEAIV